MLAIFFTMVLILLIAGGVVLAVAYPHQGDHLSRSVSRLPKVGDRAGVVVDRVAVGLHKTVGRLPTLEDEVRS